MTNSKAGYADILKQVRDGEFEQQLHGMRPANPS